VKTTKSERAARIKREVAAESKPNPSGIRSVPASDLQPATTPRTRQVVAGPSVTIINNRKGL
jgi:hypothetical protein